MIVTDPRPFCGRCRDTGIIAVLHGTVVYCPCENGKAREADAKLRESRK